MRRRSLILGLSAAGLGARGVQGADLRAERKALSDRLPFPRLEVSRGEALGVWERLRARGEGWPVIVPDAEALQSVGEAALGTKGLRPRRSADEILAAARGLRFPEGLVAARAARAAKWRSDAEARGLPRSEWELPEPAVEVGEDCGWPAVETYAPEGDPTEAAHILVLPGRTSAEAPAYLNFGDWNGCPAPEHHVAALRTWGERYGAELVQVRSDALLLRVARRPQTPEEALALARAQYAYCPDLVLQATDNLATLASLLMRSRFWEMWWD